MQAWTRNRRWLAVALTATAALVGGCQEPKEIVPVAPPGLEFERKPVGPQNEAQALGEQPAAAARQVSAGKGSTLPAGTPDDGPEAAPTPIGKPVTLPSGLVYETTQEGTGPVAKSGMNARIHYTGTLTDGSKFDSSRDRGDPFTVLKLGKASVIAGWNQGVPGMKVGERRKLTIPPDLAYGSQRQPSIPPNSTLIFDLEMVEAK